MPELPEVETIVRGLREAITGLMIEQVKVRDARLVAYPEKELFVELLRGRVISDVERRGKYILIKLTGEKTMIIHLRMTGRLLIKPRGDSYDKHTHLIFELDNGHDLRFNNLRKFGRVYLVDDDEYHKAGGLVELGPEPLAADFTIEDFRALFQNRKTIIKALLLNQKVIAGLGNIYVDEALFQAGIAPGRRADALSEDEIARLYRAVREVLAEGIRYGGTTFSDYLNSRGETGEFQKRLKVYQREAEECPRCGHLIVRERYAGRSSHYCPHCQN